MGGVNVHMPRLVPGEYQGKEAAGSPTPTDHPTGKLWEPRTQADQFRPGWLPSGQLQRVRVLQAERDEQQAK